MSFKLDLNADISDTSWVDNIEVAPAEFVRIFGGPPRRLDSFKVSGLYTFVKDDKVFTVYDWKSTSLWGEDLPSPLAFWNSRSKAVLSIGGNCEDVTEFRSWLLQKMVGAC
ncbi:MAG: hypothetical protein PHF56_14940 [Desulfuromonadaceae bacterium]|nr:hypothetical protein [Desulfuromonadaceae bacterium]